MAKLIKKSKCEFIDGVICKKNKQVGIPWVVWHQLNKLEVMAQQYTYLKRQPSYSPGPSLDGFERKSIFGCDRPYVESPDTPVIDRRVADAMEFIDEMDKLNEACNINDAIDRFGALFDWVGKSKFIEGDCYEPIDTYWLGNPLSITKEELVVMISNLVKEPIIMEE